MSAARLAWLAAGLIASGAVSAADAAASSHGGGANTFFANDSEGFSTGRIGLDYLPVYTNRGALTGVRVAATRYSQDGWSRDGQQLGAMVRSIDPATLEGWQIEGGLSRQGGHQLLSLDASYRTAIAKASSVEVFASRDWVETRRALDEGVRVTFAGAAFEQALGPHVTVVAVGGYQDFSDGNHRTHGRLKLIVQPDLELGLTLQARYRVYHGAGDEVRRSYFNPDRYDETMLAVGWRKRVNGWLGSLTAGLGRQHVGDAGATSTRLLEVALETPAYQRQSVRLRAGFNRSAAFGGPDYSYRYAQVEWLLGF